ncbi:hypothetical protein CKAH01_01492 [Colletotrichum kahawae]|uniref:Uncharacterized protein n=1 Tax=Colletotrichum kahawae TaxID=34407 RepID=A0AAD9Y689_COLKA|nr:hypothetical protein CKAH01_01492 [Colletotrichum kahawae]
MNNPHRRRTAMLGPRAFYHGFDKTSANATRCPPSEQTEKSSDYGPRALRKQHLASGDVSNMITPDRPPERLNVATTDSRASVPETSPSHRRVSRHGQGELPLRQQADRSTRPSSVQAKPAPRKSPLANEQDISEDVKQKAHCRTFDGESRGQQPPAC